VGPPRGTSWFRVTGTVPDEVRSPELGARPGWDVTMPAFQAEGARAEVRVVATFEPSGVAGTDLLERLVDPAACCRTPATGARPTCPFGPSRW